MPVIPFRSPRAPFKVELPPAPSRRAVVTEWLRKAHGWIGLWGAVLGLLFGGTGILLNHRAALGLAPAQARTATVQIPLPAPAPADARALAAWLQQSLKLEAEPGSVRAEAARPVAWGRRSLLQPARWRASFASPSERVQAEYWVGNGFVTLHRSDNGVMGTLAGLHRGAGMGAGWVLLADTVAGSIVLLSLSGVALWALTSRRRLVGLAIGALSLLAAGALALAAL